ncbi:MAG: hypothetical protein ACLU1U_03620 [Lachnospiraceae bacterium]
MRENLKRRLDTIQKNIWLTFLGVVAALAIALSVFYFFKMRDMRLKRVANDDVYKQQLENHYQMSLFRLCDSTKNADANLSKLAVSNSPAVQQELLLKIQSEADTALSDISALPLESELSGKASRFFNQLSDYCSVTAKEISSGKALTDAHRESFKNLKSVSGGLLAKLESITTQNTDKLLINALEGEGDNYLNDGLGEMEDNAFDYPQLIYDGPFSESVTNKKLETSKKWTTERMTGKLREIFSDYEIESIEYVGSVKSKADAELFEMTAKDGRVYSAELTKDGRLLSLDSYNAEVPEKAESFRATIAPPRRRKWQKARLRRERELGVQAARRQYHLRQPRRKAGQLRALSRPRKNGCRRLYRQSRRRGGVCLSGKPYD